ENGKRIWREFVDYELDTDDFETIGRAFEEVFPPIVSRGVVGYGKAVLIPQVELVNFAVEWMTENRK
ncbi:MAG: AAC(3) family N-acetyltransferase, partial [Mesotoga sp.]